MKLGKWQNQGRENPQKSEIYQFLKLPVNRYLIKKHTKGALAGWLSWLEHWPVHKRLQGQSLVEAGTEGSLSMPVCLFLSKINEDILGWGFKKFFYNTPRDIQGVIQVTSKASCPGWCGSVDWEPACEPMSHQPDSQLGHMPGLWARSPVGGMPDTDVPLPSPLSKNK